MYIIMVIKGLEYVIDDEETFGRILLTVSFSLE